MVSGNGQGVSQLCPQGSGEELCRLSDKSMLLESVQCDVFMAYVGSAAP
jgi:hypothetical protein